jgi:hypothetical protein
LIREEPKDCIYSPGSFVLGVLQEHFSKTCSLDNCPSTSNPDQSDLNVDGIGDVCDHIVGSGILFS